MIRLVAVLGFVISLYALYVKWRLSNSSYTPLCDLREYVSCSRALTSKEGSLTGLPNPLFGLVYYALVFFFVPYVFYLSVVAFILSLYLAYVSYVQQKNFCVVCTAIYIINIVLFFFILFQ